MYVPPANNRLPSVMKIVTGGQTGADRAALDFAMANGIPCGGWCPKGRRAEDGSISPRYRLQETPSKSYWQRTERNVRDSDGTVIFTVSVTLTGGSKLTAKFTNKHRTPCLHLSVEAAGDGAAALLRRFIDRNAIRALNVAGPHASQEPSVGEFVQRILTKSILCHEAP